MLAASAALVLALSACGGDEPPDNGLDGTMPDLSTSSDNGGASNNGGTNDAASDAGGDSAGEDLAASIPAPDPADYPGMDQNTPEGAEQAFKYYIAVLTWAHQTGDTQTLSQLGTGNCSKCASLIDEVNAISSEASYWSVKSFDETGTAIHESNTFDHEVGYIYTLAFESNGTSRKIETNTIGGMVWIDDSWKVDEMISESKDVT